MHFERLRLSGLRDAGDAEHIFAVDPRHLRRWNLFPAGASALATLRALALAGLGRRQLQQLDARWLSRWPAHRDSPASVEFLQVRHAPQERGPHSPARRLSGWVLDTQGRSRSVPVASLRPGDPARRCSPPELGQSHVGRLLVGYGSRLGDPVSTDCFDILPDQRLRRCAGLLGREVRLTNPVAFLQRLRLKGRYRAGRARQLLACLETDLRAWVGPSPTRSRRDPEPFERCWPTLSATDRIALTVFLDIARHMFDASMWLDVSDPLLQPGVVLFNRPETWCTPRRLAGFFELLDSRFPQLQFFVSIGPAARRRFPARLIEHRLEVPVSTPRPRPVPPRPLPRGTVLLLDVDGTLPNLALMKLSRHFKDRGRKVALARGIQSLPRAQTVLASCVFHNPASAERVSVLQKCYGGHLDIGGSGVDLGRRLPPEIEGLNADYSLYPELGERALGFLTRGCPRHCPFCVVPAKEGPPRQVSDLDALLQGRRKLILLDDNLLAHPRALWMLEEMARRDIAVNFNQTLDLRRLTPEAAQLLRRIRCSNVRFTRPCRHFSLNDAHGLEALRHKYSWLGTTSRDHVEFVCMYGFNTSLEEDLQRFRFLRSLPGAYVFVQRYQPPPGAPPPNLSRLFDDRAATLIDELVDIVFLQNMKSMETYYRWLALQYATQRGCIHRRLVETLFRFNGRPRMAGFLHRLEALARTPAAPLPPPVTHPPLDPP